MDVSKKAGIFTAVSKAVSKPLTLEALGLLVWLSQQDKTFNVSIRSLSARHGKCKSKISSMLDELLENDCLERIDRFAKGKRSSEYHVLLKGTCPSHRDNIGIHTVLSKTKSKSLTISDALEMRPESVPEGIWKDYWDYRFASNKPKTKQTIKLNGGVMELAQKQGILSELVDTAIGNGWAGLQKRYLEGIADQAKKSQAIDNQFRGVE